MTASAATASLRLRGIVNVLCGELRNGNEVDLAQPSVLVKNFLNVTSSVRRYSRQGDEGAIASARTVAKRSPQSPGRARMRETPVSSYLK